MKKLLFVIAFLFFSTQSFANRFETTGQIREISIVDSTDTNTSHSLAVIVVDGFKSAGNCYVGEGTGLVSIKIKKNEQGKLMYSVALSAYAAGKKIFVRVDDIDKDANNYCHLQQIRVNTAY